MSYYFENVSGAFSYGIHVQASVRATVMHVLNVCDEFEHDWLHRFWDRYEKKSDLALGRPADQLLNPYYCYESRQVLLHCEKSRKNLWKVGKKHF